MSKENNGGPAFPSEDHDGYTPGMTLRDYFAAEAMAAIISKAPFLAEPENYDPYIKSAIGAYDYADAMLKARDQ